MSAPFQTGLVKCRCQHCNGNIEFDPELLDKTGEAGGSTLGQTIACPHCGMETLLYIPQTQFKPPLSVPQKVALPASESAPQRKSRPSLLGPVVLTVLGIGLVLNGCSVEISKDAGAIHQVYAALNYCTGLLLIAAAFILEALRSIARNQ